MDVRIFEKRKVFYPRFLGRTGPGKTRHETAPDETMIYVDFNSLYPSVNFETDYPLGAPKRYPLLADVDWQSEQDMIDGLKELGLLRHGVELKARGVFKCLFEPCHGNTKVPPLPYRHENA